MELQNRTALVTGGGSGIGRAICERFHDEGARVYVNDRSRDAAATTARSLGLSNDHVLVADVSDSGSVRAMLKTLDRLDILVNNAGIADRPESWRTSDVTASLSDERWRHMLAVHLDGTFYCSREALRLMTPRRGGVIVNLSSTAAIVGVAGAPHYTAAKAGILGFTRALAREVGALGIRVNAIAPGYVTTAMTEALSPEERRATEARIPMGRFASASEIAALALFLAGPRSSYVTGQCLSPNGGLSM